MTPEERSRHMSKIRGKDTKPEMVVRRFLHLNGFRYRLHDKSLPGRPDIKLPKYNAVIFIHGCFWHGHSDCRIYQMPKSRVAFWSKKITTNAERDKKGVATLREMGWKVFILWECELKPTKREAVLNTLIARIKEN
jgi:DNA mismatch endonuclease (patch repair protein)